MDKQDILMMANEAVLWAEQGLQCVGEYHPDFDEVRDQRFAALVAAAAKAEENEACARIVENVAATYCEPVWALEIVNDIRARQTI